MNNQCPLFTFCNCKTAVCRVILPDENCYWYKYFEKLIKQRQSEKETKRIKDYYEQLKYCDPVLRDIKMGKGLKPINPKTGELL